MRLKANLLRKIEPCSRSRSWSLSTTNRIPAALKSVRYLSNSSPLTQEKNERLSAIRERDHEHLTAYVKEHQDFPHGPMPEILVPFWAMSKMSIGRGSVHFRTQRPWPWSMRQTGSGWPASNKYGASSTRETSGWFSSGCRGSKSAWRAIPSSTRASASCTSSASWAWQRFAACWPNRGFLPA